MGNTIEENSTELIGDIQNLQNIELDLFNTLEKGIANNTLTADDKTTIVDQINKVSEMRIKSFANLNTMNLNYQDGVASASNVITQIKGKGNQIRHGVALTFRATADHVVPMSFGGRTNLDNLVTSCWNCNYGKYNALLEQMGVNDPRDTAVDSKLSWNGLLT